VCFANDLGHGGDRAWNRLKHLAIDIQETEDVRYFTQDLRPNLTELVLSAPEILCLSDLAPLLESTPALTTLAVYGIESSISDLEAMHRNLPLLTTLKLSTLYMNPSDFSQLSPIMPATRVSTVYIDDATYRGEVLMQLLQYISKQYNNAQKLRCKCALFRHEPCNEIPTVIKSLGPQLTELSLFSSFNATGIDSIHL
jgi:hypothetical protein